MWWMIISCVNETMPSNLICNIVSIFVISDYGQHEICLWCQLNIQFITKWIGTLFVMTCTNLPDEEVPNSTTINKSAGLV